MMCKRDWPSPSPDTFKLGISGWIWYGKWLSLSQDEQTLVKLDSTWRTHLVPKFTVAFSIDEDMLLLPLSPMKYACPALHLKEVNVHDGETPVRLYTVDLRAGMHTLHVKDPLRLLAIPSTPAGPKHLYTKYPNHVASTIALVQTSEPEPLLKFALRGKHALTEDQMQDLLRYYELDASGSYRDLLKRLAEYCCVNEDPEATAAYVAAVLATFEEEPAAGKTYDPVTEEALEMLDPEDQQEFADIKDFIL